MEREIIDALQKDRDAGVALLLAEYGGLLRYIVRGILSDPRDREEALSDVCLRVCEKCGQYDAQRGSFSTWLTAIARNTALNLLRGRQPAETLPEELSGGESPEETLLRRERAAQLQKTVAALRPGERDLFYRKFYYLQSTAQIAAELGFSERSVEGRIYRLRQKLKQRLGGEGI